jgi:threonine synthase
MAPDGGLLVPKSFPALSPELIANKEWWSTTTPSVLAFEVVKLFVPNNLILHSELKTDLEKVLNFTMPIERIAESNDYVLRLDQGPTASFKDIAARSLACLMSRYAEIHDARINIVVATSGDTGVAIADAFGGLKRITVTVLYPHDGVSKVQEKQMIDVHHRYPNEQIIPIKGNFDNCQDIAKLLQAARTLSLEDTEGISAYQKDIKTKIGISYTNEEIVSLINTVSLLNLSSANSINIWRLIPQMTQYFMAYAQLVKSGSIQVRDEIVFSVPTGNVGHLMAGIYAKEIGLPVSHFIVGTNTNNILANIIGEGVVRHRPFSPSSAPSMDILDPSNLERLLHFAAIKTGYVGTINYAQMKNDIKRMTSVYESIPLSTYGVTEDMLTYLRELVWAEDVETDEEIHAMMRDVSARTGIVLEPHGVTGYIALVRARAKGEISKESIVVIFETAHPDKFPDSLKASGLEQAKHPSHPRLVEVIQNTEQAPSAYELDLKVVLNEMTTLSV